MMTAIVAVAAFVGGWWAHSTGWHVKLWNKAKEWWNSTDEE